MKRALLTFGILGCIATVLIAICWPRLSPARSTNNPVQDAVESAITNPLSAITNHALPGLTSLAASELC